MLKISILNFLLFACVYADEPITPLPLDEKVDIPKAKLGKELFFDTILSRDHSTACVSCHDIYNGGADIRKVSEGFNNSRGDIHAPTVLNAKYNFKQFWNGRAKNLVEQADGPINNPVEHNMDAKKVEERINASQKYKKSFKEIYGVTIIPYALVLDAIVEFENALTTPNAKFDKYLRKEANLTQMEEEGYALFKQYGCITCHNGINVGGNSFQKMGTFLEYKTSMKYPDRSKLTNNQRDFNVFKVPTLRNVTKTAPYFHDASAATLKDAITMMSRHNLGVKFSDKETQNIIEFLKTLEGEQPKILDML